MEVRSYLVFGRVCIVTVDLLIYVNDGAGWGHSDDQRYFQSLY